MFRVRAISSQLQGTRCKRLPCISSYPIPRYLSASASAPGTFSSLFSVSHPSLPRSSNSHKQFSTSASAMVEYKLKDISSLSTLGPLDKIEVEVEGIQEAKVLLVKVDDQVHALSPRCTHYGAPLKNGVLTSDGRLTCPWHGGKFLLPLRLEKRLGFGARMSSDMRPTSIQR